MSLSGTSYATCMGEEFFRGNVSSDDGGFACLFATETQLNLLKASTDLFMDATFQTVPKQFYQLFTLFVEIDGFIFPTCYVLMTRKTTQMYTAVFTKIKEMLPDFLPHSVQADFEDASVNAFKSVFGMNVAIFSILAISTLAVCTCLFRTCIFQYLRFQASQQKRL